jgi:hypothetical protein
VQTEDLFIASTSQRAIIFALQSYEPNDAALSWMLFSGNLGPGLSWDRRIRSLPADSRLTLDRQTWESSLHKSPAVFKADRLKRKLHEQKLRRSLDEVFTDLGIDVSKWMLPLSGGRDSRLIFMFLRKHHALKTITWGLASSMTMKGNDAYIARQLAIKHKVDHEYFETDISSEPIELIFHRFLVAGEGRIDNISAYLGGVSVWKYIFESGFAGVIRGDEGLGDSPPVSHPRHVRAYLSALLASDYANVPKDRYGFAKQEMPGYLERSEQESLETWRERFLQEYRLPYGIAALNEIKCAYVEVINPLLSRKITERIRTIPDRIRCKTRLFDKIIRAMGEDLPFATGNANAALTTVLKTDRVEEHLISTLDTDYARNILSSNFVDVLLKNLGSRQEIRTTKRWKLKSMIKPLVPKGIWHFLRSGIRPKLDYNILAFRAYIIVKMNVMLNEDAANLQLEVSQRRRVGGIQ